MAGAAGEIPRCLRDRQAVQPPPLHSYPLLLVSTPRMLPFSVTAQSSVQSSGLACSKQFPPGPSESTLYPGLLGFISFAIIKYLDRKQNKSKPLGLFGLQFPATVHHVGDIRAGVQAASQHTQSRAERNKASMLLPASAQRVFFTHLQLSVQPRKQTELYLVMTGLSHQGEQSRHPLQTCPWVNLV